MSKLSDRCEERKNEAQALADKFNAEKAEIDKLRGEANQREKDNANTEAQQTTEERILKNVQLPVFRKNVEGTLTQNNTYLSTPTDYLSTFSLALIDGSNNYSYLLLKQVSFYQVLVS